MSIRVQRQTVQFLFLGRSIELVIFLEHTLTFPGFTNVFASFF